MVIMDERSDITEQQVFDMLELLFLDLISNQKKLDDDAYRVLLENEWDLYEGRDID